MYMYVYIYIYIYMYKDIHTYTHTHIHTHIPSVKGYCFQANNVHNHFGQNSTIYFYICNTKKLKKYTQRNLD
jgi:hypothetical protein